LTTHNRARILTTLTESSRRSDARSPGLLDRTTYIGFIKRIFGNATSRAAIIAKRLSAQSKQWRIAMSVFKILIAAALLSTATISSASAAWSFADQEPAAFASMYPDRDVLNGGALTPAGRMGLERPGGAAPVFAAGHYHVRNWHR
jgi:hypothetical protein